MEGKAPLNSLPRYHFRCNEILNISCEGTMALDLFNLFVLKNSDSNILLGFDYKLLVSYFIRINSFNNGFGNGLG